MNVFVVPSWYPSASNPTYGIFVKEQVAMMAKERPSWKIGVSTWGQGDPDKLIWIKDHFKNLRKFDRHGHDSAKTLHQNDFKEYYQPALSWSKKIRKGNIREVIRCNELNYQAYTLENGKPDVITVQACYPAILVAHFLSKKYKIPVHLHIRLGGFMFEYLLKELGSMKVELLKAIRDSQVITVTSSFHQEELGKWISSSKVHHNPVDLDFFKIEEETRDFTLAVGRLEEEKGFDLLLQAINLVPNITLKIAGDGSEKEALLKQIDDNNLNDRVSLLGEQSREQVRALIQECKFLVLPSMYETFGNILLEAAACGRPIVATKCGGPQEIVQKEMGYLADVDKIDLGQKIHQMNVNFNSFSPEAIRASIQDRFSPQSWIDRLENIFKGIC